jgi:hypothetical protein
MSPWGTRRRYVARDERVLSCRQHGKKPIKRRRACFSGHAVFIAPGREAAKYGTRFARVFLARFFCPPKGKKMRHDDHYG